MTPEEFDLFGDRCNLYLNCNNSTAWQYGWIYHPDWEMALLLNRYPMASKGKHKDDYIFNKAQSIDEMMERTYDVPQFNRPNLGHTPPYFAYVPERFFLSQSYRSNKLSYIEVLHEPSLSGGFYHKRIFEYFVPLKSFDSQTTEKEIKAKCPNATYECFMRYKIVLESGKRTYETGNVGWTYIFEDKEAVAYLEATRGAAP